MPKYETVHQIKDNRGVPGDLRSSTVEAASQQAEWLQVAVAKVENVPARDVVIFKSRKVG